MIPTIKLNELKFYGTAGGRHEQSEVQRAKHLTSSFVTKTRPNINHKHTHVAPRIMVALWQIFPMEELTN